MGDDSNVGLVKIFIFLAVVFLLIGLITPGQNTAWNNFQTQLQAFPTFNNPFDVQRGNFTLLPSADGSGANKPDHVVNTGTVPNCTPSNAPVSNWFGCLRTLDASVSYASTNNTANHFQFNVTMGLFNNAPSNFEVIAATVSVQCRSYGASAVDTPVEFDFQHPLQIRFIQGITCHAGGTFKNETVTQEFASGPYPTVGDFADGTLRLNLNPATPYMVDFSYVQVKFIYVNQVECTSANSLTYIGCIIGQGITSALNFVRLIINAVVFIGQALVYFGNVIVGFFGAVAYLLSFPGAPDLVQKILQIITIGFMFFFGVVLLSKIRGAR